ncbi:MAG: hypothetical protein WCI47_00045 [bacterium]
MADHEKHIIYLEHDAEVTEAVEKLKDSEGDTVRLVVPGRSPLLQSVVNLKLLKRAAESKKKELIIVTSDKAAMALAGKVGLQVAKNVKSASHVVAGEPEPTRSPLIDDEDDIKSNKSDADGIPVRHFDEEPVTKSSKSKASKGAKIPNYDKFKIAIWAGSGFILFLLFGWVASAFLQTATVKVQATAEQKPVNTSFILSATDNGSTSVLARPLEVTKDLSQTYQATGQVDKGTKASGTITLKNCEDSDSKLLPAGSKLSNSGKVFTTNAAVTIPNGSFSGGGAVCKSDTATVTVTATENGDAFNFSGASFAISNLTGKFNATGTTSGGVSKKTTVVTQGDIDGAQKTAIDSAKASSLVELKDKARTGQRVFDDTLQVAVTSATPSAPADTEAASGNLTMKVKYIVFAAEKTDIEGIIKLSLKDQLSSDTDVLDSGVDAAEYAQTKAGKTDFTYSLKTTAFVGKTIDKVKLAQALAGKEKKEVTTIAQTFPNVSGATVDSWPIVSNMPLNASNIKIEVKVVK